MSQQHLKMQQQIHMRNNMPNRNHFQQRMIQQQQNQQQFHSPHQFTKQTVDVKKDTEKLQNDQQRLTTLHSKLHKEAEKIRQWKTEKELEVKQKERSLSDAIQTIDSLRKSILELQFQNEEFSGKLHTKQIEKEETEQKLVTVRELANVLRDQMIHLESRISRSEQDKEEISQVNRKMVEENQSLVLKFQELDISQASLIEKHKKENEDIQKTNEIKVQDMQTNIRHLENQIISLIETKTKQEKSIKDYSSKLKENMELIEQLKSKHENYEKNSKHNEEVMTSQANNLLETQTALKEMTNNFQNCNVSLSEITIRFQETESEKEVQQKHAAEVEDIYSKEINSLQFDLKNINNNIKDKDEQLKSISEEKEFQNTIICNLKEAEKLKDNEQKELIKIIQVQETQLEATKQEKDSLVLDIEKLQINLEERDKKLSDITGNLSELHKQSDLTSQQVTTGLKEKGILEEQILNLNERISQLSSSGNEKENLMQSYSEEIKIIKKDKQEQTILIMNLENIKKESIKKIQDLISQKDDCTNEMNSMRVVIDSKDIEIDKLKITLNKEENQVKSLLDKLKEHEEHILLLSEKESENKEVMKTELADQERKAEDLGSKSKSLQSQLNVKVKQMKNMEKENKSLKIQLKKQTDKVKGHEADNTIVLEEKEKLQEKLCESNKNIDMIKSDLEAAKTSFDREQKDFCETLNQYKIENDKIVESYLAENRNLKHQNEEIERNLNNDLENLRIQCNESSATIEERNKLINKLKVSLQADDIKDSKISELEQLIVVTKSNLKLESEKLITIEDNYKQKIKDMENQITIKEKEIEQLKESTIQNEYIIGAKKQYNLLPTTPKIVAANTTPQSEIKNSQFNRGKRVLFTGLGSETSMETERLELEQKTPKLMPHKEKIKGIVKPNIRFSPKPSPSVIKQLENEEILEGKRQSVSKLSKKNAEKNNAYIVKSQDISNVLTAHYTAAKDSPRPNKNIFNKSKSPFSRVQNLDAKSKGSPGDVSRSSIFKKKMKKVVPKIKKSQDNTLSWFGFED